ncbi:MAG: cyclase family protein [Clostridia bacterium]|nr:cyclase family protein [Clostridia bacterium]
MKIYDISQELFSCAVWPGDPAPKKETLCSMDKGDVINLTAFSMCAHNGTHIDAPFHFINEGKKVDEISLERFIGFAYVADFDGTVTAEDARNILSKAESHNKESAKKILIKGKSTVSLEAAKVFAEYKVDLIGNESQTVGPEDRPMAVHKVLLAEDIVLLEGVRLGHVPEGVYLLNAAPINLAGVEGAPCRAVLIELK